ncbi:hypothetical protein DNTS_035667 [Danionella cerebrum]|uniref:Uncharacterized protein n=1 Tax=Danionella cerebrum TaxID=2873325 RepID=A0A553QMQ7_9TELE|nr:hypothetical protein DNTS_035667 [Danionella translucida]
MLSRNLVLASVLLVFLVCSASPAPVEDKEPEENDFETEEAEEELSEEEEDDDDSRGQHMKGAGSQQATAAPKGSGLTSGSGLAIESPHDLSGVQCISDKKLALVSQVRNLMVAVKLAKSLQVHQQLQVEHMKGPSVRLTSALQEVTVETGIICHLTQVLKVDTMASNQRWFLQDLEVLVLMEGQDQKSLDQTEASIQCPFLLVRDIFGSYYVKPIRIISSGQGSSGHFSAGHGSVMSSSHVIIQPPAGQTSDGAGLISSEVQLQPGGSEGFGAQYENEEASEASQIESPEVPETESNGNGHKHLLNGGEPGLTAGVDQFVPGTSHIQATGGFDSFGTSPHMEITGGMGESFGHETQTDGLGTLLDLLDSPAGAQDTCLVTDAVSADHMGLPFQVDSPGAALIHSQSSSDGPVVDAPPDYLSADNGNGDYTHTASSSDNGGQYRPAAETTDGGADYNGGDNGADSDTNGNGNGRHKPVLDVQKGDPSAVHPDVGGAQGGAAETTDHTAGGQHAFSSIPDAVDHTFSPYADMTGHGGVTGALGQTDAAGAAGDHVTDGLLQTEITGQGHLAVTDGLPNLTADCVQAGPTGVYGEQRTVVVTVLQRIRSQHSPRRQMPWAQFQQVNSSTHLVRVLKVQKMWNWKIPADFHMKPRVRFLRYRFQCTDQNAWQRNRNHHPAR